MPDQHRIGIVTSQDQSEAECYFKGCTLEGCSLRICQESLQLANESRTAQETESNLTPQLITSTLEASQNSIQDHFSNKLPVEIISEIFFLVAESNDNKHNPTTRGRARVCPASLLSSVSRRWRQIGHSLPRLWTIVYINLWREPERFFEEWLNRSGALPLYLTIYVRELPSKPKDWDPLAITESVFNVLRSHSARWEYLNFEHAPTLSLETLFRNLDLLPKSNSFHLRLGSYKDHGTSVIHLNTPLRPGHLFSKNRNMFKVIPLEWSNLTHIELCYHVFGEILDLIRAAPKLKRGDFQNMSHSDEKPVTPVEHRSLEDLTISFNVPGSAFFRNIKLPSLRRLKYHTNPYLPTEWNQFYDLKSFLVRSQLFNPLSLQTFALGYWPSGLPVQYDHSVFFELTTATHLTVLSSVVEPLFHKLNQDNSIFPYLEEVKFDLFPSGLDFPTMEPGPLAILAEFVTKHNLTAQLGENLDKETFSHDNWPLEYRRSFKTILVKMFALRTTNRIKMTRDTFLRLQEGQKNGPLKFNIVGVTADGEVDVLNDPRYLEDDGSGDDFMVLQLLPTDSYSAAT